MDQNELVISRGLAIREAIAGLRERGRYFKWDLFDNFCGSCAIASVALQVSLGFKGIHTSVVQGSWGDWEEYPEDKTINHAWLFNSKTKEYYDITMQQWSLDFPAVFIGKELDYPGEVVRIDSDFKEWPERQRPSEEVVNLILEEAL